MADSKSSEPNRARNRGDTVPSAVSRSAARRDRWRRPWLILLAGLAASLAGATARALTSVDCDTPDDFCTGDPCVTADNIEITVPACVLDFGARALVLAKVVFVPNDGTLSLTAGSIEVDRRIDGQHVDATEGDGADISLIATGNITLKGRVDAAGRTTTGAIVLDAGGDIDLRDQVRSRAKGHSATATGGTVTIEADGTVTSVKKGKVDVRGKRNHTPAGQATISGQAGVSLGGQVDVRGNPGGSAVISSSLGDVVIGDKVRGEGMPPAT
jgi:hypothetical protein